jgi:hypothetical protein
LSWLFTFRGKKQIPIRQMALNGKLRVGSYSRSQVTSGEALPGLGPLGPVLRKGWTMILIALPKLHLSSNQRNSAFFCLGVGGPLKISLGGRGSAIKKNTDIRASKSEMSQVSYETKAHKSHNPKDDTPNSLASCYFL